MVIYCSHSQSLPNVKLCETLPISHSILQRFLYRFCLKNIHKILKVVGGVDDGSPPVALTQSSFCKLATGFGATLHCQARSLKKCYQAV